MSLLDGADLFGTDRPLPALLAALEQSPIGVVLLDADGAVTFENDRFRQSVGEEADQSWAGRTVDELPGLAGPIREAVRRLVARGIGFQEIEGTFERADGSRAHLLVSGTPVRRAEGGPASSVLTALDVTPWREGDQALGFQRRIDAAEASLRNAALSAPNTLALLEAAVRSLAEALDATRADALVSDDDAGSGPGAGPTLVRCASWPTAAVTDAIDIAVDDWPALTSGRPVVVTRGEPSGDALLTRLSAPHALLIPFDGAADGAFLLARYHRGWTPAERAAAGRLAALFSTLWAWAEAEARFHRTVADLDDALFTVGTDDDGRRVYVFVTPQAEAVTGLDPDALLSGDADWADLVHDDDRAAFDAHDARLRAGDPSAVDVRLVVDGETVWVRERATPNLDAAGRAVSGGILTDISAQKEAEATIERARRIAERAAQTRMSFLRMMSHELRTPLGAIRGFAELLEEEVAGLQVEGGVPPEATEFSATIRESAERALDLVSNLLDLSRLETEALDLRAVPVDVRAVAAGVVARRQPDAAARGLALAAELGSGPATVLGDPARLEQIVDQLVSNALKFTPDGRVTVTLSEADRRVAVAVADTGVGIAEDFLDGLFEPFAQEDHRVNRDFSGSGLGLAIASRLARQMGGRLEVESEKGAGSTFRLVLPVGA